MDKKASCNFSEIMTGEQMEKLIFGDITLENSLPENLDDTATVRALQAQLVMVMFAHQCRSNPAIKRICPLASCVEMAGVLDHLSHCRNGSQCPTQHCASSKKILYHFKYCKNAECVVCKPLRKPKRK